MTKGGWCAALCGLTLVAGLGFRGVRVASAQVSAAAPFAGLERIDGTSGGNVELGVIPLSGIGATPTRIDLSVRSFASAGYGVFAGVPFSFLLGECTETSTPIIGIGTTTSCPDDVGAIGNVELGGGYVHRAGRFALVTRAGVALPTASSASEKMATNMYNAWQRITDLSLSVPNTIWFRPGVSGIFRSLEVFVRADAGVDFPVRSDYDLDNLTRFNIGVGTNVDGGMETGVTSLFAEVSIVTDGDATSSTLGVGARFGRFFGWYRPFYVSLLTTVEAQANGRVVTFKVGLPLGGRSKSSPAAETSGQSSLAERRRQTEARCRDDVARWSAEADLRHKTELFDALPEECRELVSHH